MRPLPPGFMPDGGEGSLRKVITLRHAVAMYISSVIGPGILVVPGLAAQVAGPGSIAAWVLLTLASYPFAFTFARLSARNPTSGGIYSFAQEAFGQHAATTIAWLFVAWELLGAPAATMAAGAYVAEAFSLSGFEAFLVAASLLLGAFAINYRGIRLSGRVQVVTVVLIVAVLAAAVGASVPRVAPANFAPFLPYGPASVGVAAALIVWSYLGYENVSNVAEEFKDPKRDFDRAVLSSVVIVGVLYLAVAVTIVGTGVYLSGGGVTPFSDMMSAAFGTYGGMVVAVVALFIIFGTVNAYTAGFSRVFYAAARDGGFPRRLATIDPRTGVPRRALVVLMGGALASLLVFYAFGGSIESAFLATSGAAIIAYVIGSAAGIRLLRERGARRALPWISLLVSLGLIPFIGPLLGISLGIAGLGFAYSYLSRAKRIKGAAGPAAREVSGN
jgi:amino acid efflux transporter